MTGGMAAIERVSMADRAADAILKLIVDERLRDGDSLPSSQEMSRRLDVSIVVVREALASLAGRGILVRRQGREPVVSLPGHEILSSILRIRAYQDAIGVDEFQECRAALEVHIAGLAACAGAAEDRRAALEPPLAGMRTARTAEAFNESDLALHHALAALSGNRAMTLMLGTLNHVIRESLALSYARVERKLGPKGIERALEMHDAVCEAVVRGDAAAARHAMQEHFQYSLTATTGRARSSG